LNYLLLSPSVAPYYLLALAFLGSHTEKIQCVAFSPDGTRLASGDEDQRLCLHEFQSGNLVASFHRDGARSDNSNSNQRNFSMLMLLNFFVFFHAAE
jgi:WD40 repeat protein